MDLNYQTIIFSTINLQSQIGRLLVTGFWILVYCLWFPVAVGLITATKSLQFTRNPAIQLNPLQVN